MLTYKAEDLTFQYPTQEKPLFSHLTLTIRPHTFNLITGANGSGKSTLLRILAGIQAATHGTVWLNEQDITQIVPSFRVRHVAFLPQNVRHFFTFKTGKEQLRFALANIQTPATQIAQRIAQTVKQFSLESTIDQPVELLSGGELQQIAIAILLNLNAEYLLLDEPFTNLDEKHQQLLVDRLRSLKSAKTIIITDHHLQGYDDLIDSVYSLKEGQLQATTLAVTRRPATYTVPHQFNFQNQHLTWQQLTLTLAKRRLLKSSLGLPSGQVGLLWGENGSGKTTFFNALTKQVKYQGTVTFDHLNERRVTAKKWFQYVTLGFQNSEDQFIKTTVREELHSAAQISHQPDFWSPKRIQTWTERLKINHLMDQSPYFISGGQQKKVQLLILAIIAAPVILFDEVLTGLDQDSIMAAFKLFDQLAHLNLSILIIDHELNYHYAYDYVLHLTHQTLTPLAKGAHLIDN